MEFKKVNSDFELPVLGLGTWMMGGAMTTDTSNDSKDVEAIKAAIKLGYTLIDTAQVYGGGHCEELVGQAIKEFDRSKLFIVTKVFTNHLSYEDVIEQAKISLEKLGTDYVDLYLIHAPNPEFPIGETIRAMDKLVDYKLARFIGVSNFNLEQLKEAQKYSKNKIVVNQIEYSLLTRNKGNYGNMKNQESELIPYAQENDILIMAERPLERGLLLEEHPVMDQLSEKYGKTKAQIAINWLISKKNVVAIPKSSNIEHLNENMGAIGWKLDEEDIELLDKTDFSN